MPKIDYTKYTEEEIVEKLGRIDQSMKNAEFRYSMAKRMNQSIAGRHGNEIAQIQKLKERLLAELRDRNIDKLIN